MMPFFKNIAFVFFIAFALISISCKNVDSNSKIQGNWQIQSATRNGRPTLTLDSGYIRLWNKDSIETNFTGEIIKTNYVFKRKKILTDNVLPDLTVINLDRETMAIEFLFNGVHFYFILSKS